METQANRFPNALMWIAGIAIILFCAAGIGAIMGWIPTSIGHTGDGTALANLDKPRTSQTDAGNATKPAAVKAHSAAVSQAAPVQVADATPAHARCAECGVVESTREVDTKGQGTGLGAVGGAVVGGLLGNQIGNGRGRELTTVVGAVGGVVAGNEIEKRVRSTKGYDVTVRLHDGSSRVVHEASASAWHTGDHVKVVDGVIRSN